MDQKRQRRGSTTALYLLGMLITAFGAGVAVGVTIQSYRCRMDMESVQAICSAPKTCECACRCVVDCPEQLPPWPEELDRPEPVREPYEY